MILSLAVSKIFAIIFIALSLYLYPKLCTVLLILSESAFLVLSFSHLSILWLKTRQYIIILWAEDQLLKDLDAIFFFPFKDQILTGSLSFLSCKGSGKEAKCFNFFVFNSFFNSFEHKSCEFNLSF